MSSRNDKQTRFFGFMVILIQIAFGLIYGYFVDFDTTATNAQYLIVIIAIALAFLGMLQSIFRIWLSVSLCQGCKCSIPCSCHDYHGIQYSDVFPYKGDVVANPNSWFRIQCKWYINPIADVYS